MRLLPVLLGAILGLFGGNSSVGAAGQEPAGGARVYRQAIPSVVWIHSNHRAGLATGSGSLIDRDRRLILTNYHVVEDNPRANVFFPVFRGGQPVPEKRYYLDRIGRLGYRGRVIEVDKQADLAILQLDALPDDVRAIPLAPGSPAQGDNVHSIGNTGKSGALWGYVKGSVRNVYNKTWKARLDRTRVLTFRARVIETDSPTNPGDSGGPLLNDRGELVGVTQGGAVDANLVSFFVDVSEVKQLLGSRKVRALRADRPASPPETKSAPQPVTDRAGLFSPQTIKTAEKLVAELHRKKFDLLVETHTGVPEEMQEKVKTSQGEERANLFREWAYDRLREKQADGMIILVSSNPNYVVVEVPERWTSRFPQQFARTAADALIAGLRSRKPDEGLTAALKLIETQFQEAKK